MATEKCFCHLGEYKVKDADARKEIDNLYELHDFQDDKINEVQLKANDGKLVYDEFYHYLDYLKDDGIPGIKNRLSTVESDIATLKNSDGGSVDPTLQSDVESLKADVELLKSSGGAKLYKHTLKIIIYPGTNLNTHTDYYFETLSIKSDTYAREKQIVDSSTQKWLSTLIKHIPTGSYAGKRTNHYEDGLSFVTERGYGTVFKLAGGVQFVGVDSNGVILNDSTYSLGASNGAYVKVEDTVTEI